MMLLEFGLAYHDVIVQLVSHYTPRISCKHSNINITQTEPTRNQHCKYLVFLKNYIAFSNAQKINLFC